MAEEDQINGSKPLRSIMQEMVLDKILEGMYQTNAYMEVYKPKSVRVAESAASRLLSNVKVKARFEYKKAELAKKFAVNEERITRERVKIGFANIRDFMDETGHIRPINQISRDKLAAVSSVKLDPTLGTVTEFKFHSKQEALDKLSCQLGLYAADNAQKSRTLIEILAIVSGHKRVQERPVDGKVIDKTPLLPQKQGQDTPKDE